VVGTAGSDTNINLVLNPKGTGFVGIGTTLPSYELEVNRAGPAVASFRSTGSNNSYLFIDNVAGGNQSQLMLSDAAVPKWAIGKQGDNSFHLYDYANGRDDMRISTGGDISLVPAGGNVGIGTTTPSKPLDVGPGGANFSLGNSDTISFVNAGGGLMPGSLQNYIGGIYLEDNMNLNGGFWGFNFPFNSGSSIGLQGGEVDFFASPAAASPNQTPQMVVQSTGNVGIGTTTPAAKLDVNGQIRSVAYNAGTSMSIDWNNGNNQYTAPSGNACAAVAFTNMLDGGSYTLAVQGVTSGTCTFSQSGLTFVYAPANDPVNSDAVYTFLRMGTKVYVSWVSGFQ
jgi:hypothetical protein